MVRRGSGSVASLLPTPGARNSTCRGQNRSTISTRASIRRRRSSGVSSGSCPFPGREGPRGSAGPIPAVAGSCEAASPVVTAGLVMRTGTHHENAATIASTAARGTRIAFLGLRPCGRHAAARRRGRSRGPPACRSWCRREPFPGRAPRGRVSGRQRRGTATRSKRFVLSKAQVATEARRRNRPGSSSQTSRARSSIGSGETSVTHRPRFSAATIVSTRSPSASGTPCAGSGRDVTSCPWGSTEPSSPADQSRRREGTNRNGFAPARR